MVESDEERALRVVRGVFFEDLKGDVGHLARRTVPFEDRQDIARRLVAEFSAIRGECAMQSHAFKPASGLWLWLLDRLNCDGLTMPWGTIYLRGDSFYDVGLRVHELEHIAQMRRMGRVRFCVSYLYQLWRHGYWAMPLEIEARRAQERAENFEIRQRQQFSR